MFGQMPCCNPEIAAFTTVCGSEKERKGEKKERKREKSGEKESERKRCPGSSIINLHSI